MTMAISVFHYPFYDKLGSRFQTRLCLLALAFAFRFRLRRDLLRPDCRPFLSLPEQRFSLLRRLGPRLLYQGLTSLFCVRCDLPRFRFCGGLRVWMLCSVSVTCLIASKDMFLSPSLLT